METTLRTTCPRDCYDSCGITAVQDEDGTLKRLVGDANHHMSQGKLCQKCSIVYNGSWRDPGLRLSTPLKRSGPKGDGAFVPVSWNEALSEIAGKLNQIATKETAAKIYHTHYTGTCSVLGGLYPLRFFNKLGATEVDPDTVCNNAAHASLTYTFGESCEGFDPDTVRDSACVLIWGANPSAAAPHVHEHWLRDARAKVVVIDPIAHPSAKSADIHLQLRPGTDAALAFGLLHIARRDGHIDHAFLAAHVIGWEEVLPDIEATTPQVTAELTGLDAGDIERVAEMYTAGPALIWLGQGLQRQKMGGNAYRACALLCAATGNLGKPGSGILFLNGPNTRGADVDYVVAPELADGAPDPISQMDLADHLQDAGKTRALICWNNNIVASNPQQTKLRRALGREDLFQVSVELFQTDTTAYADYVLPAASFMECEDLLFPYFHNTVSALNPVQAAPGVALSNAEIFRRLAHAMGFNDPKLFEADREVIDHVLENSDVDVGFDELKKIGTKRVYAKPRVQFESLTFPTPSGKIEVASERAEADGCWRAPKPHADAVAEIGRIRILSPASPWTLNTSYGNDEKIRQRMGRQAVRLNPNDATRLNIADGQTVILRNAVGELKVQAQVSEETQPGVAVVLKGTWPMFADGSGGNINLLNPGDRTDMGESSCVHSIEAQIAPAD
jgi:anaerobic selenocysteine-containing dehydrogenase